MYSPSPATADAAINSFLFSTASHQIQAIAAIQQDLLSEVKALDQEIFQAFAALEQKWLNLLGIRVTASNQAPNDFVMPPVNNASGRGSGSGSGAATTHHNPDRPIHSFALTPGSGAGNGVSPDSSGGTATVYGNVWLDADGNGSIDHGEAGFQGITVSLLTSPGGSTAATTTTDANGNYSITIDAAPAPGSNYVIQVSIPNADYATIPGYSQINANGTSAVFALYAGEAPVQINAGIRSMQVTTLQDDAAAAIPMQITLRDAMDTGNNGLPTTAVTFVSGLSGTISLQAELPAINANYNILGPTANPITVNGNDDTGTVFTVNATTEIDNLVIEGGDGVDGGGIDDNGNLTLNADTVTGCDAGGGTTGSGGMSPNGMLAGGQAAGSGGFLYVKKGDFADIPSGNYSNNNAGRNGGGVANYGRVILTGNTIIDNNTVNGGTGGGGIYNGSGAKLNISGNAKITNNTNNGGYGGGVQNAGIFTMSGGLISGNKALTVGGGGGGGGGIDNAGGTMTLTNVAIQNNQAGAQGGGGIYVGAGTVTLKNVQVGGVVNTTKGPKAAGNKVSFGGGIFINLGTVKMSMGSVANNSATAAAKAGTPNGNGGGIYNLKGSLTIQNNVGVSTNKAKNNGGGMYFAFGSTSTFGPPPVACTIAGNIVAPGGLGNGAYQQVVNGVPAAVINWIPAGVVGKQQNVFDTDDGAAGMPIQGP